MGDYEFKYLRHQQPASKQPDKKDKKPHGCIRALLFLVQIGLVGLILGVLAFLGSYVYLSNELSGAIDQVATFRGTGLGGTPRF